MGLLIDWMIGWHQTAAAGHERKAREHRDAEQRWRDKDQPDLPSGNYVRDEDRSTPDDKTLVENLDGVLWRNAPVPPPKHRCWVQTNAWINYLTQVHRCACGAIRIPPNGWRDRNSRTTRSATAVGTAYPSGSVSLGSEPDRSG